MGIAGVIIIEDGFHLRLAIVALTVAAIVYAFLQRHRLDIAGFAGDYGPVTIAIYGAIGRAFDSAAPGVGTSIPGSRKLPLAIT